MAKASLIPVEQLGKLLRYEAATGKLFWRERTPDMFKDGGHSAAHTCSRWNSRYAEKEAFTKKLGNYRAGSISKIGLLSHRVIWAMAHGEWPKQDIDHINGNPLDNRLENLRDVSRVENSRNQKMRQRNTSGVMGVSWYKPAQKWRARIKVDGKSMHLGFFDCVTAAAVARKDAEAKHGFHPNHGRE